MPDEPMRLHELQARRDVGVLLVDGVRTVDEVGEGRIARRVRVVRLAWIGHVASCRSCSGQAGPSKASGQTERERENGGERGQRVLVAFFWVVETASCFKSVSIGARVTQHSLRSKLRGEMSPSPSA